jgi:hypothetical protein
MCVRARACARARARAGSRAAGTRELHRTKFGLGRAAPRLPVRSARSATPEPYALLCTCARARVCVCAYVRVRTHVCVGAGVCVRVCVSVRARVRARLCLGEERGEARVDCARRESPVCRWGARDRVVLRDDQHARHNSG